MRKMLSVTTALASLVAFYGVSALADAPEVEQNKQNAVKEIEQNKQKNSSKSSANQELDSDKIGKAKTKLDEREKRICNKSVDKGCGCKHDSAQGGPRITIGGASDSKFHFVSDDKTYHITPGKFNDESAPFGEFSNGNIGDYSKTSGASTDAVLHVRGENTNYDLNLVYGADVRLNIPVAKAGGMRSRNAYIFAYSQFGDVTVGFQEGAESVMRLDASKIAAGDGGADSSWFKKANLEGEKGNFPFHVAPRLYSESLFNESNWLSFRDSGKYNKSFIDTQPFRLSYYSPTFMGLKFGASYSPNYDNDLFTTGGSQKVKYLEPSNKPGESFSTDLDARLAQIATNTFKAAHSGVSKIEMEAVANAVTRSDAAKISVAEKAAIIDAVAKAALPSAIDQKKVEDAIRKDIGLAPSVAGVDTIAAKVITVRSKDAADLATYIPTIVTAVEAQSSAETIKMIGDIADAAVAKMLIPTDAYTKIQTELDVMKPHIGFGTTKDVYMLLAHSGNYVGPNYENIISGGVSYEYDFDDFKIKVSATAETGKVKEVKNDSYGMYGKYNDLGAFNLGLSADYDGFKFAASYANLGKSGQPKEICTKKTGSNDYDCVDDNVKNLQKGTYYWTAGAGYEFDNIYVSGTYFKSKSVEANELSDIILGVQYNLSQSGSKSSFVPYVAWHHFKTKEKDLPTDKKANKGDIFLAGVKFTF